jgi:hypothetical protein
MGAVACRKSAHEISAVVIASCVERNIGEPLCIEIAVIKLFPEIPASQEPVLPSSLYALSGIIA